MMLKLATEILAALEADNATALQQQGEGYIRENIQALVSLALTNHAYGCFKFLITKIKPEKINVVFDDCWMLCDKHSLQLILELQRQAVDLTKYQDLYEHFHAIFASETTTPNVKLLLTSCQELLFGFTPLCLAIFLNQPNYLTLVLQSDLTAFLKPLTAGISKGTTPLFVAAAKGHTAIVEDILAKVGADKAIQPLANGEMKGMSPLFIAAYNGHVATVEAILATVGVDKAIQPLAVGYNKGMTPLHTAAYHGHAAVVEAILARVGVDKALEPMAGSGSTPLYTAALKGHAPVVKVILARVGADKALEPLAFGEGKGMTPLYTAAYHGHVSVVEAILAEVDANKILKPLADGRAKGETPLFVAACYGHTDTVEAILAKVGIDKILEPLAGSENKGLTPLHAAAIRGSVDLVQMFLQRLGDKGLAEDITRAVFTQVNGEDIIRKCCENDSVAILIYLLYSLTPKAQRSVASRQLVRDLLVKSFYRCLKEPLALFEKYLILVDAELLRQSKPVNKLQLNEIMSRADYAQKRQALFNCHPKLLGSTLDFYAQDFINKREEFKRLLNWRTPLNLAELHNRLQDVGKNYLLAFLSLYNKDKRLLDIPTLPVDLPLSVKDTLIAAESTKDPQAALKGITEQLTTLQNRIKGFATAHSKLLDSMLDNFNCYQEALEKRQLARVEGTLSRLNNYFASCRKLSPELQAELFKAHPLQEFFAIIESALAPCDEITERITLLENILKQGQNIQKELRDKVLLKAILGKIEDTLMCLSMQQKIQEYGQQIDANFQALQQVVSGLSACSISDLATQFEQLPKLAKSIMVQLKQLEAVDKVTAQMKLQGCQLKVDWQAVFSHLVNQQLTLNVQAEVYSKLSDMLWQVESRSVFNLEKAFEHVQMYSKIYQELVYLDNLPAGWSFIQLSTQFESLNYLLRHLKKLEPVTLQRVKTAWQRLPLGTEIQLRRLAESFGEKETDERRKLLQQLIELLGNLLEQHELLYEKSGNREVIVALRKLSADLKMQSVNQKSLDFADDYITLQSPVILAAPKNAGGLQDTRYTAAQMALSNDLPKAQPDLVIEQATAASAPVFTDKDITTTCYGRAVVSKYGNEQNSNNIGLIQLPALVYLLEYYQLSLQQNYPTELVPLLAEKTFHDYFNANLYLAYLIESLETIHQQPNNFPMFDIGSVKKLRHAIVHESWHLYNAQCTTLLQHAIQTAGELKDMVSAPDGSYDCLQLPIYKLLQQGSAEGTCDYHSVITHQLGLLSKAKDLLEYNNAHLTNACKGAIVCLVEMTKDKNIQLPPKTKQMLHRFRMLRNDIAHPEAGASSEAVWDSYACINPTAIKNCCSQARKLLTQTKYSASKSRFFAESNSKPSERGLENQRAKLLKEQGSPEQAAGFEHIRPAASEVDSQPK